LIAEVLMAEINDKFHTLKEAKESSDWLQWDTAIWTELDQHQEKGAWELVDKPADAVPLTNKWVFVRKRDKEGRVCRSEPGTERRSAHRSAHVYPSSAFPLH
jgi:hypothetical protein